MRNVQTAACRAHGTIVSLRIHDQRLSKSVQGVSRVVG